MLRLTSDCTAGAMRMACGRIHLSWRGSTSKRSDKELAAVGVGAGVGHRERERAIVPEVAVEFVLELAAPAQSIRTVTRALLPHPPTTSATCRFAEAAEIERQWRPRW